METGLCPALPARGRREGGASVPWARTHGALSPPVPSNIKSRTTLLPELSEQVSGNVQKWLESLPKAQSPRAKEEARTSAWCWDCPHL